MVELIEELWFKVMVLVVSAALIIIFAYNVNTYRILRNSSITLFSKDEMTSLLVVNAIALVFAIILTIWAIYRLIISRQSRERIVKQITTGYEQVISGTGGLVRGTETGFDIYPNTVRKVTFSAPSTATIAPRSPPVVATPVISTRPAPV